MSGPVHHLIIEPGETFVPRALGARFAPIVGATAIDEAQRLRYAGGWLWRDGDEETVEALAEVARDEGLAIRRLHSDGRVDPVRTERVLTADLERGHLFLETAHELVDVAVDSIDALDICVVGEPRAARRPKEEEMHRWAEGMLMGLSFPQQREALLGCGLARPNPQVFIVVGERFLRIERGTRFPALIEETGPQALDSLLLFIDRLLAILPPGRALPEVERFWSEGVIEPVLHHRVEQREQRLTWLRAWLEVSGTTAGPAASDAPARREEDGEEAGGDRG